MTMQLWNKKGKTPQYSKTLKEDVSTHSQAHTHIQAHTHFKHTHPQAPSPIPLKHTEEVTLPSHLNLKGAQMLG